MVQTPRGAGSLTAGSLTAGSLTAGSLTAGSFVAGALVVAALRDVVVVAVRLVVVSARAVAPVARLALAGVVLADCPLLLDVRGVVDAALVGDPDDRTAGAAVLATDVAVADALAAGHRAP
jgi:hypothetical protein